MSRKTRVPPTNRGEIVPFADGRQILIDASSVAEMAERVEHRVNEAITKLEARAEKALEEHGKRLTELERWQWGMKPYIAAIAALLTLVGGIASAVILDEIKTIKAPIGRTR